MSRPIPPRLSSHNPQDDDAILVLAAVVVLIGLMFMVHGL